ncbi:MAG: enoyl-CoA hydratase-related protein [Alphaproteobacteria bacterium]
MHKPVIAQVHGHCLAGGTDVAFLCDMVIAADDANIGFPRSAPKVCRPTRCGSIIAARNGRNACC